MIHLAPNVTVNQMAWSLTLLRLSVVHQMELRFRMATITTLFLTASFLP
ncbi:Uncharacterised protein [Streptococcus pneumoniae]|nr:Uncharacterised protein [Streptococcus pneumoniae]CJM30157.1 Uncharacterised protein [Streptococcus pneumoniae]CKV29135.1 Uncharacterised protein [Mycobacterium tuberculosis]VJJ53399.1 Uncharacterised protein [Streptococcus pneumoniae]